MQAVSIDYDGRPAIMFQCPGCECCHYVTVDEKGWKFNGDMNCLDISPSIMVSNSQGTMCHSYVRNGKYEYFADCKHKYAGQTIPVPDFDD